MAMKERWYRQATGRVEPFGVLVMEVDRPIGLAEYMPRPLALRAGYVTGTWGDDREVLTLTCLEVGWGMPRLQVLEFTMQRLLEQLESDPQGFRYLEAMAVYEKPLGFNPYWLLEKYGFARKEERVPGQVVIMAKPLGRPRY